jgi:transcriptional regulator GlxA family with amidase domain
MVQVALVLSPGVVVSESRALRSVLSALPGSTVVGVGDAIGTVVGAGGTDTIEASFAAVPSPAVIAVPGAIGVHHLSQDAPLLSWLGRAAGSAEWVLASSTGSVVVAAAGLLEGLSATTHWLATDLLAGQGAEVSDRRIVRSGKYLTCQGAVSAIELGLYLAQVMGGPPLVAEVHARLLAASTTEPRRRRWPHRRRAAAPVTVVDLRGPGSP